MTDSEDNNPEPKLDSIFHEGLDLYNKICNSDADTKSVEIQRDISAIIQLLQQATRLVSLADIFSTNETIEELATNNIKYLLLPALLGMTTLKKNSNGHLNRKQVIDTAEIYFIDFLQRTNCYGLSNYEFKSKQQQEQQNDDDDKGKMIAKKTELQLLADAVNTRTNKIQKYQKQKQLKHELETLKQNVQNKYVDEEVKRNYFLTMIKSFIFEVIDELESIEMEKPILEHMSKIKGDDENVTKSVRPPMPTSLKPFIITRNDVQKAIYGAGYPSLPTMTVQEFYDKRVADGVFPDPHKPAAAAAGGAMSLQAAALAGISLNSEEKEQEDIEKKIETDNEEYINQLRSQDEYKDEHRRGWGNRMNRS